MTVEPLRVGDPSAMGAYELLGRLGEGGMGQVFLGRAQGGRMVAVKVVREDLARQLRFRQRFRAEVRAAQRVSGRWTAPVLDCDTESDVPWVATGYVAGVPLQTVVDSLHGPLAEESVWALAHGLGQALTRIQDAGLIHRDLKPSNVMVSQDGPKVIDFGIARAVDANTRLTMTGAVLGTPGYMAPEQISGERLTGAVDVFALGVVLAYAATGISPFSWDGAGVHTVLYRVMNEPPRIGPADGPLQGALRELAVRCMAKEPDERPDLAEILSLAKAGVGSDFWLSSELTARLGQVAEELPALDGPVRAAVAPKGAEPNAAPPAVAPDQTTYVPAQSEAWALSGALPADRVLTPGPHPSNPSHPSWTLWPGRRRGRYLLGAVAAVMALVVGSWLVVKSSGANSPGEGGSGAHGPTQAPLADVVPQEMRDGGGVTVHVADRSRTVLDTEHGSTPTGFEVDLIKAMGQQLGVHVRFTLHADDDDTAPAAVEKSRAGGAHLAMADLPDSPENRRAWGVDMVDHSRSGLGYIGDVPHDSLSEVCGLTIATYPDEQLQADIREEADCRQPLDFLQRENRNKMVDAVQTGEADLVVVQYPLAVETGYEEPDAQLRVGLFREGRGPRGIAVPHDQPKVRDAVFAALKAVVEDGTYKRLLRRWELLDAAYGVQINGGT